MRLSARHLLGFILAVGVAIRSSAQVRGAMIDVPGGDPQAFDLRSMGAYHPTAIFKDDVFLLYWHGGGPSDVTGDGNPQNSTWSWSPVQCNTTVDGSGRVIMVPGHPECNDRAMFGWKHLSCALGGACASNQLWNVYPFAGNYPAMNYANRGPGSTSGLTSMASWATGQTFPNTYLPPTSNPNAGSYTGAGGPASIYVNGRYFMAYDINVGGQSVPVCDRGGDVHRIGWAYSDDGVTWTHPGLVIRDASEERNPTAGIVADQLYFENGYFYMVVTSLETQHPYMMRAAYSSAPPYYSDWKLPTALDGNGNFVWGYTVPNYNVPGQPAAPVAFAPYHTAIGTCDPVTNAPSEQVVDPTVRPASASFVPLFDTSATCNTYNPAVAVAKVYRSRNDSRYRYIYLVPVSNQCAQPNGYPVRVFSTDSIERPPSSSTFFEITAGRNFSHAQTQSTYGWQPMFVWLVPGGAYTQVYNPASLFVTYADPSNPGDRHIGRIQLKLTTDIYDAVAPSDIIWRNFATGANATWAMAGTNVVDPLSLPALPNLDYVVGAVGDFNADSQPDIVWHNTVNGANAIWLMDGSVVSSVVNLPANAANDHIVAGADFNGDGSPDLLIRNSATGNNTVWLMSGTTVVSSTAASALPNTDYEVGGVRDFNGDSQPDIVWRNRLTGANAIWIMSGVTAASVVNLPGLLNSDYYIGGVADVNADGNVDILWRNDTSGANAAWLMNGTTFGSVVNFPGLAVSSWHMSGPR